MFKILWYWLRGKPLEGLIAAIAFYGQKVGWEISIGRDDSGENVTDIILAPSEHLNWIVDLIEREKVAIAKAEESP